MKNKDKLNLNIGNNLSISNATENDKSESIRDEWGGDLKSMGRAAVGGAITGLSTGAGMMGGEYLGNAVSSAIGNSFSGATANVLSATANGAVNGAVNSYTNMIGSAMSNTAINGGNLGDILKAGGETATDSEVLKRVVDAAEVAGVSAFILSFANGAPNTETGSYEDSKVGVNVVKEDGVWYKEKIDNITGKIEKGTKASFFTSHIVGSENPLFKLMNAVAPTVKSGAFGHDTWVARLELSPITTALSAPPYLILNFCAAGLCGVIDNNNKFNYEYDKK